MKRNKMRIVCNPYTHEMAYYLQNELGEWNALSADSPLSRQYYTKTTINDRVEKILGMTDAIYNRKNKGLDIIFEGTDQDFKCINKSLLRNFKDRDITCKLGITKIVVIGKIKSGKSYLIEGLEEFHKYKYYKEEYPDYVKYIDESYHHIIWYEVKGIDLGNGSIEKVSTTVSALVNEGVISIIYCIPATSGRIEKEEIELIKRLEEENPSVSVMIALTMCYREHQSVIDEIEKSIDHLKVIPMLAKEYIVRAKGSNNQPIRIEPFGLDEVSRFVFEGR